MQESEGSREETHALGGCKGQWFRFDDSMVTLASEKEVLGVQAYLLFYIVRNLS